MTDPIEPKADTALGPEPSSPALSVEQSGAAPDANVAYAPDNASSRPRWYGIVWATLAIALYVAIADAAVETFLHESPLRWWIAGATALYFILCAATWRLRPDIWRRMDWATQSAASLVVLMAALGATAWMPEGLEQGLSLFGQTTSTVFAVVSAVVVALSGVLLARLSFISLPGKIAVGLLAAYGVAAFLLAAYAGTPYASLFHGGRQWTRLPFWLQGATVGGLVLVPLALLLQIGTGLRQITRAKSAEFAFKAIALCMGFMIAFAAVRMPADDVSAATVSSTDTSSNTPTDTANAAPADTPTATSAETQTSASSGTDGAGGSGDGSSAQSAAVSAQFSSWRQMGAKGPGLSAAAAEKLAWPVPRTVDLSYVDPTNFAAALGNDPAKIFSFVRDRIAYEAYPGSLRGPRGTLLAMAGNSVDRAALLAALLQSSGQTVRFARGTLSDAQAQELIASMWRERARSALAPARSSSRSSRDLKAASDALQKNVQRDVTALHDHLSKAGEPTAATVAADPATLIKEAEDHYWVQWSNDGKWTDLDPSFADATPGQTFARISGTIDTLPSGLFQRVEIHVSIEEYTDGKPSTREVLHYAANAADLSGTDVLLMHRSTAGSGGIATPESVDKEQAGGIGKSIGGLFGGINGGVSGDTSNQSQEPQPGSVKPMLVIAGQSAVVGESFQQRQQAGGGGGGGGFGLGGGGGESTPSGPVATAESVEIDFLAPGRSKETVVRQIFDVVDRPRRAEKKLLNADEVSALIGASQLDLSQAIYDLFFTTGSIDVAHFADLSPADEPTPPEPGAFDVAMLLRRVNITFAASSDAALSRLARPDGSVCRLYLDSPRVQIADVTTTAGVTRLTLDLRRDKARAVGNGVGAKGLFYTQMFRGVLDGTLERVLVDYINTPPSGASAEGLQSISTSWIMEQGQAESVPLALMTGASSSMPSGITPATTTLLRQGLGGGYLLLVPNRAITLADAPRLAWWQVDRHSGETIAVTDEGLYQAVTEYRILIDKNAGTSAVWWGRGGQITGHVVLRTEEVWEYIEMLQGTGVRINWTIVSGFWGL